MPFITRKSASAEMDAMLHHAMRTDNGVAWGDDVYRPSRQARELDGRGLPASLDKVAPRRICGYVECAGGWTAPWRNRRRPIFEGQWGCSGRCVLAMVRAAVRREQGDGRSFAVTTPHRHRVPLGLLMLSQGWITHPQLRRALEAQRESGSGRIGDWLISECGVDAEQVTRGLGMQWGCPVLTTEGFSPEAMALVMPRELLERYGMAPLRVAGARILYLGFGDRLDASAALALEQMTDLKVESGVVEGSQFETARRRLLECDGVESKVEKMQDTEAVASRITAILEQKQPIASRMVRLHEHLWLRLWLESGTLGKAGNLPASREDVLDYIFSCETCA